jgi:acetoacetyl-CoA reductase/3-oxoacyl-[acyl-carrier protein] reductase
MYIITGASRGIGQYLFNRLRSEGEDVAGTFYTTPQGVPDPEHMFAVDVGDAGQVLRWIAGLQPRLNKIVLINCAGISYNAFGHKADLDRWQRVIQVNLIGSFNLIRALLPTMRAAGYGRIINFSSVVAQTPVPGTSAYAASKAALWGLSRALAVENASKGITINSLNLGYFDLGIIREVPADLQQSVKARIPSGSFGRPDQIYQAIKFVIATEYMNGASLDLNGGMV